MYGYDSFTQDLNGVKFYPEGYACLIAGLMAFRWALFAMAMTYVQTNHCPHKYNISIVQLSVFVGINYSKSRSVWHSHLNDLD